MKPELHLIPMMTVHPDRICTYKEVNWYPYKPSRYNQETGEKVGSIKYEHLLKSERKANGAVSKIARRKISKALDYLLLVANDKTVYSQHTGRQLKFKIAFVTLTLPSTQVHDDREIISKCLNQFLIEIKKFYHVKNYIWRAEKQNNGNIHFHIIIDKFIPWSELRDRWNRITNKLGYVDRYRDEMRNFHKSGFKVRQDLLSKWSYKSQVKAYRSGHSSDWNSPNSTDVHSIRKIWNIKAYVSKYMTKNEAIQKDGATEVRDQKKQSGRIWGCNRELSNPTGAKIIIDNDTFDQLSTLIEQSGCANYHGMYFDVWFIDHKKLHKFGAAEIQQAFFKYLLQAFGFSPQYQLAG